jgi:tetratricopeptide (TPR) repeat protein
MQRFDAAWPELPWWDWSARRLVIETALVAGECRRARQWLTELEDISPLPDERAAIYEAWLRLGEGDLMASLSQLAKLPQQAPAVAYLQALALVEQRRHDEATPWIERARRLWPGRVELEVASARVAVATGELGPALRKLEGLAEEEPFAPRAWTGLGEAYLATAYAGAPMNAPAGVHVASTPSDPELLRKAHRALLRAVEREPIPAEAMLRLSELWQRQRLSDPDGDRKALDWLERAATANPKVPRYSEALALYLAGMGHARRAAPLLRELLKALGSSHRVPLTLAELSIERARKEGGALPDALEQWLSQAQERGAAPGDLARVRAHAALVTGRRRALKSAQKPLAAAVKQSPEDVDARVLLVELMTRLHEYEDAEKIIRQGIHRIPRARAGRLFFVWAKVEARTGSPKMASIHARVAWTLMRDEQRPTGDLLDAVDLSARLYIRKDMGDQALTVTRELSRRVPSHPEAWRLRARTEFEVGESSAARRSIQRALELDPLSPEAHALHAQILTRYGKRAKARAAYKRALELEPSEPLRVKMKRGLSRL